ncbi:MAG: hypothetical protein AAFS10_15310 [Myxococcota bacterium]
MDIERIFASPPPLVRMDGATHLQRFFDVVDGVGWGTILVV